MRLYRRAFSNLQLLLWSISTIALGAGHPLVHAQAVTTKALRGEQAAAAASGQGPSRPALAEPLPDMEAIPFAVPLPPDKPDRLSTSADVGSEHGDVAMLSGDVEIQYRNRTVRADSIQLNRATGDVVAEGHLRVSGGENEEYLQASHGTFNVRTGVGRFYDVAGSVGLHNQPESQPGQTARMGLASPNPFLFSGRIVEKTGPTEYVLYDGTVTSCLLPKPDWLFSSRRIAVTHGQARAVNSTFRLLGLPVLYLPFLTTPASGEQRQSGLLIPVLGDSSTKGITVGADAFLTLGRSADLTVGLVYYSLRGYAESGTLRYRGLGDNFITGHFSALQDRGYAANNGVYVNQGGEDLTAAFRRQLSPNIRAVGDGEYLSSYLYREAFTENFNQAVSSDITSIGYVTRETNGWSMDGRADRYQGLKQVPLNGSPGAQVHILHVPSFDLFGEDRPVPGTPFHWTVDASVAGLKRVQPNFTSSGIVERFDFRPEISLPVHVNGWNVLGSVAVRETVYSRSRQTPYPAGAMPVELTQALNRADAEFKVEVRPPVLERSFAVPARLQNLFGTEVRHTLEPEVTYRNVKGVSDFLSVLRFDEADLVSDTDQLEYGLTQHLYFRPKPRSPRVPPGCPAFAEIAARKDASQAGQTVGEAAVSQESMAVPTEQASQEQIPDVLTPSPADSPDANGIPVASAEAPDTPLRTHARHASRCMPAQTAQEPLVSWRLAQRYFFDPTFGHAVVLHRRNIFESTLALSGIAFLTEPRNISPLISRLRVRTSGHTDAEWDFDYDSGATKFTSSNVFFDAHEGPVFGGVSYARLNAPGRFATEVIDTTSNSALVTSPMSNFSQLRFLVGYGVPSKPGFAIGTNVGLDLNRAAVQYGALEVSYNWNCCGLAVEYRKFNLGTVRDENAYRFNFTLANIGSAGNIRRAERLF